MVRQSLRALQVLRNQMCTDLLMWLPHALSAHKPVNCYGDCAVSYVKREDCARASGGGAGRPFSGTAGLDIAGWAAIARPGARRDRPVHASHDWSWSLFDAGLEP